MELWGLDLLLLPAFEASAYIRRHIAIQSLSRKGVRASSYGLKCTVINIPDRGNILFIVQKVVLYSKIEDVDFCMDSVLTVSSQHSQRSMARESNNNGYRLERPAFLRLASKVDETALKKASLRCGFNPDVALGTVLALEAKSKHRMNTFLSRCIFQTAFLASLAESNASNFRLEITATNCKLHFLLRYPELA